MKCAAIGLALLILGASLLLETAWACTSTTQKVGEVTLPDSDCAAGCMRYDVNVVWNGAISWQYQSLGCTSCPETGVALTCGN